MERDEEGQKPGVLYIVSKTGDVLIGRIKDPAEIERAKKIADSYEKYN